jgi:glutamate carboxypeptidase
MFEAHLRSIDDLREPMIQTLIRWSEINSASDNLAGLSRMVRELIDAFTPLADVISTIELEPAETIDPHGNIVPRPVGKALIATRRADAPLRVLLNIHYDTVYAATDAFQKTAEVDASTLCGPGVLDAKGGIVVMLTALRALEQSPFAKAIGWEVLLNPDEEIGSPSSAPVLADAAKRNHLGLVFEPALSDGNLVGSRKGAGTFTAIVRGRAAHAGRDFAQGRSAIHALAQMITMLEAAPPKGVIINCGTIEGGGAVNIVPDLAIGRFNVRVETPQQQREVEMLFHQSADHVMQRDGITVELHGKFNSPPKPLEGQSAALMDHVITTARELGMNLTHRSTGGVCDGNKLQAAGLPVVDSLGPVGGGMHSHDEFVRLDSLVERSKLVALLLMKLAAGQVVL